MEGKLNKLMFVEWLPGRCKRIRLYANRRNVWERTRSNKDHLINEMQLEQSLTDPCLFFKKDDHGNLKLMALTHVDDTLIAGNEREINDFKKGFSERFKFRDEGILQNHLGVTYEWKHGPKTGEKLIKRTMKNLVDDIIKKYKQVMEREATEIGRAHV